MLDNSLLLKLKDLKKNPTIPRQGPLKLFYAGCTTPSISKYCGSLSRAIRGGGLQTILCFHSILSVFVGLRRAALKIFPVITEEEMRKRSNMENPITSRPVFK